jgi:hypothetical protein
MNRVSKLLVTGAGMASAAYASYFAATWLRYGHAKPARGDARDELLDRFMPRYEICERHAIDVAAPAEVTLAAAKTLELESSPIIRGIFKGREWIVRSHPDATARPDGLLEHMKSVGWGVLADTPCEVVLGAVTKPWEANPVFRAIAPADFVAFGEPDYVKIAWTLRVTPTDDGGSTFRTETRAVATDPDARKKFRRYWSLLSPGIIVIRWAMLPALAAAAARAWRLEGDDVFSDARAQFTHTITIAAPPQDVWPWLLQMGCQRAGWYSWDWLDNAGKQSADRIIPELQTLAVGDVLPWKPTGAEGFEVLRIVPEHALVLRGSAPQFEGTWAFVLEPLGPDMTRLITRYRAAYPPSLPMAVMRPVMRAVHAFMERKQLRTIKHHAEHLMQ